MPKAVELGFRGGLKEAVTPYAGSALLIEVGRRSGVMTTAERALPAKQSSKGLGQGQLVEACVVLSALGGECLDDFDPLRQHPQAGSRGLAALLG